MSEAGAPPRRQAAAAIVALSVLTLLAVAAVASLLMADSDARADARPPEEVVRDYFTAADRDDCETMLDLVDSEVFDQA